MITKLCQSRISLSEGRRGNKSQ